jgi:hypothetical protein
MPSDPKSHYANVTLADIEAIERIVTASLRGQKALPAIPALLNVAAEIATDLGTDGEMILKRLLCGLLRMDDSLH